MQELKENEMVPLRDWAATMNESWRSAAADASHIPMAVEGRVIMGVKRYYKENQRVLEGNDNVLASLCDAKCDVEFVLLAV